MLKRLLILAAPLLILATPAGGEEKPKTVGQYVDLQPVALPIVVDGKLVNYAFAYVRVNLTGGADVSKLRTKEPFFRDALVRESHRTPFVIPGDWQKIDEAKLSAVMIRDARAIVGADAVASVVVTSQAPQRPVMPPRAGPAG
jgi:hypothetical protein